MKKYVKISEKIRDYEKIIETLKFWKIWILWEIFLFEGMFYFVKDLLFCRTFKFGWMFQLGAPAIFAYYSAEKKTQMRVEAERIFRFPGRIVSRH